MKRLMSKVKRPKNGEDQQIAPTGDGPEAVVAREVIAFCESGAPGSNTAGEEYLHLPAIVDGAESSPPAAKEAAATIRRFLSKEHYLRGFAQYNAVMLLRILTDNPGKNFTQNIDKDFVGTVKKLLRESRDQSVQQIMRETLDYLEAEKAPSNDTLNPLMDMWRKEKGLAARLVPQSNMMQPTGGVMQGSQRRARQLPPPEELAARIEEGRSTARLLLQTMQSAPAGELHDNELVREFAARARAAQKSIQGYMHCEDPRPDDDTMLTLIETNEQLNMAMSKHQRTLLQARRTNSNTSTPTLPPRDTSASRGLNAYVSPGENVYSNSTAPVNGWSGRSGEPDAKFTAPPGPPPSQRQPDNSKPENENPFSDEAGYEDRTPQTSYSLFGRSPNPAATNGQTSRPFSPPVTTNSAFGSPEPASRPGGYAYVQPTQSYLNRQESSSNHITMSGASPPQGPVK